MQGVVVEKIAQPSTDIVFEKNHETQRVINSHNMIEHPKYNTLGPDGQLAFACWTAEHPGSAEKMDY